MSRVVAVIGATGQLGQDLVRHWHEHRSGERVIPLSHAQIQVEDEISVQKVLMPIRPDLVINTAAEHQVDAIEKHPERAMAVNAIGARNVAMICRDLGAAMVQISTDYVFSGLMLRPYVEDDPVDPVNAYGVSKAAGEMLVRQILPRHFIVRTSGLYGRGRNFVETMLKMAIARQQIKVVDDQLISPTGTAYLAAQVAVLSETVFYGTYHATCGGICSWYEFAEAIFEAAGLEVKLERQSSLESGAMARRPACSVLENRQLMRLDLERMPHWRESLREYLASRAEAAA